MFADLIGKGGHVRTVPVPDWVGVRHSGVVDSCSRDCRTDVPRNQQGGPNCLKRVQSKSGLVSGDDRLPSMRFGRCRSP